MKNYKMIETKYIDEIASNVTIYRHEKTDARIATFENEDTNKVFSIAFRTPPINDCGLTHILEHSVLCGSKNFPVKDPFVELLKSSLNTFLNAFTFPDKTMYPCASQNDKDFANLMHVYMDAVFYPRIYQNKEIFEQEGWHYHLENKEDPITINGVVYNEMKGAFSDPQQSLFSEMMRVLYPDTAYGFESGGDPRFIPELSYETFCDFHSKFYHPSNSYIFLYGNCDMQERLEWLDEEYLSKFDAIDFDTHLKLQAPFEKPVHVTRQYPVGEDDSLEDKTFLSYNVVFPNTLDVKLVIATQILMTSLFDVPGAPLKQALIDAKIGQDISSMFDDAILQPLLAIVAINANSNDEDKFISIIETELRKLLENGLDKQALLALINHAEFAARERAFSSSSPQGLNIEMAALTSWLYDDNSPFTKLEALKYYRELKDDLNTGYFESIIEKYILGNTHKAYIKLEPAYGVGNEKDRELKSKLASYKASLTDAELEQLIASTKHLAEYQNEKDTIEAINTLPKLALSDIKVDPEVLNLEEIKGDYPILLSDYHTNGIAYVKMYFDISHLNRDDLAYASLCADLFKQMSTSKMSYREINQRVQNSFGSLYVAILPIKTVEKETKLYLTLYYSAVTENVKEASDLLYHVMKETEYKDEKRLYEYLCQMKANLDMSVVQRGHQVAMTRCMSYVDELARIRDDIGGIGYMDFISDLVENFEAKKSSIIERLYKVYDTLISKSNMLLGFTGSKAQLEELRPVFDEFYNKLPDSVSFKTEAFVENAKNEGITAQFDVNYVARVGKYTKPYHGGLIVLSNAMNMDYLWMQVRVHGGAYGCFMNIDPNGYIGFTSYRDPNIRKTNDVYQNSAEFIKNLNPTDEQLVKFKIGAIGNTEAVRHVREKADIARMNYLRGMTYENRRAIRHEILSVTKEELKGFANLFEEALSSYTMCTIGNTAKIEEDKDLFLNIRTLTK